MRKGAGRTKEQSRKDRRDESAGMEKSMGRRKYAAVDTMDVGNRMMEKGGKVDLDSPIFEDVRALTADNYLPVEWMVQGSPEHGYYYVLDADVYEDGVLNVATRFGEEESTLEDVAKSLYKFLQFADIRDEDGNPV